MVIRKEKDKSIVHIPFRDKKGNEKKKSNVNIHYHYGKANKNYQNNHYSTQTSPPNPRTFNYS